MANPDGSMDGWVAEHQSSLAKTDDNGVAKEGARGGIDVECLEC